MKGILYQQRLPSFTTLRFLSIAFPGVLWIGAILGRPYILQAYCALTPLACTKDSILWVDQLSFGMENSSADLYSYWTQNLSGLLAYIIPLGFYFIMYLRKKIKIRPALLSLGADFFTLTQVIVWNGFFTESAHLVANRPRPFVYIDPLLRGSDPAHYTSFYSGHTSFTAATSLALFFILFRRKASIWTLLLSGALFETLVLATAYFRVLAGRHFLSDVICGAIAGSLVATGVFARERNISSTR